MNCFSHSLRTPIVASTTGSVWLAGILACCGAAERATEFAPREIATLQAIAPKAVESAPGSGRRSKQAGAAPIRLASVLHDQEALAGIHDVQLQGNYAYVAGKGPGGTIKKGEGSFAIIDVTDPRKPAIAGRITEGLTNGETVLLDGDICYLGSDHFWSVDVSDKRHPRVLAKLEDPAIKSINGMVRLGSFLYAASKSGHVTVFDIRNPKAPKLAAVFRTRGNFGSPHDIDRWDDQRVVVVNIRPNREEDQLRVYKVSDSRDGAPLPPEQWVMEGALNDQRLRGANRVRVRNNVAFVMGNKGYSLGSVTLSRIASPVLSDWFSTSEDPRYKSCGMDLAGEVMIASGSGVIGLFNIAQAPRLEKIGEYEFTDAIPGKDIIYRQEQTAVRLQFLVTPDHDLVYRGGFFYTSDQDQDAFAVFEVVDQRLRRMLDQ